MQMLCEHMISETKLLTRMGEKLVTQTESLRNLFEKCKVTNNGNSDHLEDNIALIGNENSRESNGLMQIVRKKQMQTNKNVSEKLNLDGKECKSESDLLKSMT